MTRKSQAELESPAKVYQLDAVDSKVETVLQKLDEVLSNTKGVATVSDVTAATDKALSEAKEYTNDEISKVHLTYGPMKNNLAWFTRLVLGQGVVIVIQLISMGIIAYLSLRR